ncbi:MAG TPA: hypothetical protein VG965_00780 [Patescibacteria group bacterium]|nr:hypothetical protein [Patescibacteria group bacterium]
MNQTLVLRPNIVNHVPVSLVFRERTYHKRENLKVLKTLFKDTLAYDFFRIWTAKV